MRRNGWFKAMLLCMVASAWAVSLAQAMTLTIDYDGSCNQQSIQATPDPTTGTLVWNITSNGGSFTCGNYTIKPLIPPGQQGGGEARVEVPAESTNSWDQINFLNAKLTKTGGAIPDLHVTFWADNFVPPPSNSPTAVWYRVRSAGKFLRGAASQATGSYIKFQGFVNDATGGWHGLGSTPPTTTATQISYTVGTDGGNDYSTLNLQASSGWPPPDFGSPRTLKGEFWVHLVQDSSDALKLTNVIVENFPGGGRPCDDPKYRKNHPKECGKGKPSGQGMNTSKGK